MCALGEEGQPDSPDQEQEESDGPGGEHEIGRNAHPVERFDDRTGCDLRAAGVPHAVFDGVVELIEPGRDQGKDGHRRQPAVKPPKTPLEKFVGPGNNQNARRVVCKLFSKSL